MDDDGAALDGVGDVPLRALERDRVAHRAHVGRLVERIADAQLLGALDQQLDEAVVHVAVHEHALGGRADLAGEVEAAHHGGVRGGLEVGVGEHDLRPVAAELEDAVLEARVARDLLAGRDRAGEDDRGDVAVAGQQRADVAAAVHEVDGAGGEAGLVQHVDEQLGAQRRELGRLPDRRAAEGQAVDDRDAGDVDREVPGRDGRDHADRLLDDDDPLVRLALRRGQHLAGVAEDVLGRAPEVVGGVLDHLLARLADRLAGLARDHARDLLGAIHADVVGAPADLDALEHARAAPRLEGRGGGRDGLVDLLGVAARTEPSSSPEAGLRTSISSPSPGSHSPPMKAPR